MTENQLRWYGLRRLKSAKVIIDKIPKGREESRYGRKFLN